MTCTFEKHQAHPNNEVCKDCGEYVTDSTVRGNMMKDPHYRGYCGYDGKCPGTWPRTVYAKHLKQFQCTACGWTSKFPEDFINLWLEKWKDDKTLPQMRHFL